MRSIDLNTVNAYAREELRNDAAFDKQDRLSRVEINA